jgi:adenosylhomocysteine nucleosidase
METWLIIAAGAREFAGILHRASDVRPLECREAAFARQIRWRGVRWILLANGPGPLLVDRMLSSPAIAAWGASRVLSTGFCGALDPALRVGDIVVSGEGFPGIGARCVRGEIWSADRVAVSAEEKRQLWQQTGAVAVEMESAAVRERARAWGLPFHAVKVVSDTADEDLPLNFNHYRDGEGRFQLQRIAAAAIWRPLTAMPQLMRLNRNCRRAADRLGEFFAECEF